MARGAPILLLVACGAVAMGAVACAVPSQGSVTLRVVPGRPDAQATVVADEQRALVQVWSQSGIGSAELEVTSVPLPKKIIIRLHLAGLEQLLLTYDGNVVTGSVASTAGNGIRQSRRTTGGASAEEQLLSPDSAYWMNIRLVSTSAAPATIPLQEGYIDVEMPAHLIGGGTRKFSIRWIDFYR